MKRSPLQPGAKSLERGSTFSAEPTPLKRTAPSVDLTDAQRQQSEALVPARRTKRFDPVESIDGQAWGKRTRNSKMGASTSQKAKRRRLGACVVTGDLDGIDSAHLWPRSMGGCGDEDCIVPLRRDVHELFDRGEFDLLPYLIAAGCIAELQHALGHANGNLIGLLERLTGCRWRPEGAAS